MAELARYETAKRALADFRCVDQVKAIHARAVAIQEYARQAKDSNLLDHVTNNYLRAERRAGELKEPADSGRATLGKAETIDHGRAALPQYLWTLASPRRSKSFQL
jgi:hypothetical protein